MKLRTQATRLWWIPALLVAVALAALVAPQPQDARPPVPQASSQDVDLAPHGAPVLVGQAPASDAQDSDSHPASEPGATDPGHSATDAKADADDASESDANDDDHLREGAALTASHPLVARVIKIQNRHTRELLAHPLVVGTATGMNERGEIAVVVLAKSEITDLPRWLDGAPVMIYVTGELFASKGKPPGVGGGGGGDTTPVDPTARFDRPVPIGVSTGHPAITAGTIGCRVTDGTSVYALSNNHVYADENAATAGSAVIQPGTYDGGTSPADNLGTLDTWVNLDFRSLQNGGENDMDAALALSDAASLGAATPSNGYGLPKTTTLSPAINLRVQKYGRTSGPTTGKIFAINANVNIGYSSGTAGFVGQIVITPGSFSYGGDSGSLIVGQKGSDARKPVALLFAGSSSSTIATPIDAILTQFSVSIDGE